MSCSSSATTSSWALAPTSKTDRSLNLRLERLPAGISRLCLAFSAGIDSRVLLRAALDQAAGFKLELWHVNYGLQPNALHMEQLAIRLAEQHGLTLKVDRPDLGAGSANLESRARQARYELFAARLDSASVLLTAHHMNDQAETLLINLLRGSGALGLSAMQALSRLGDGWLYRPLLGTSRREIEQLANAQGLDWIDDPSNASVAFDRNFLRHEIIPRLEQRWPAAVSNLARSSQWQSEQQELLDELARRDLQSAWRDSKWSVNGCLGLDALNSWSWGRRKNLVRFWLRSQGRQAPGFRQLEELLRQVKHSNGRAELRLDGYCLREYAGSLFIVDQATSPAELPGRAAERDGMFRVGDLDLCLSRASVLHAVGQPDQGQALCLRFRSAPGSLPTAVGHRLKRLFQKQQVPPWMRPRTPLVFANDQLVGLLTPRDYSSGV